MLTLSVEKDPAKINELFEKSGIKKNEDSLCLRAMNGERQEGYCLFDLDGEKITVRFIEPLNDLFLADGILRSTLHVAAERFILKAYYSNTVPEDFFKKLDFIKDQDQRSLDIDKLFKSCQGCSKEG